MKFNWKTYKKPIIALAPMEGYTDTAYRQIVKSITPGTICYTEFSSTDAIKYKAEKIFKKMTFNEIEQPLIVQIFGNDPESFKKAVKTVKKCGFAGIDINMGCPAKKVISAEQGSALIKNPSLAADLVKIVKDNCNLPVSVKTRLGFDNADIDNFYNFCGDLIKAGADCLCIHGRITKQKFSGMADWNPVYELKKQHPNTIIIGNGDIRTAEDALNKLKNLDGIMIGRATIGNPWIMAEIQAKLDNKKYSAPKSLKEKIPTILKHIELIIEHKGEKYGLLEVRKHIVGYFSGAKNASKYRKKLMETTELKEVHKIFDELESN